MKQIINRAGLWVTPLVFLAVFFFFPLFSVLVLAGQGTDEVAIRWSQITRPLGFTLYQALLSTLLTLLVGLPAAGLFSRFSFRGKTILRVLSTLPFVMPTVVVAAGFNALIGPRGWLNLGLMSLFDLSTPPIHLLNTLGAILLAHVFYNTSVVIRIVGSAWVQLDSRTEQAARCLGASPLRTWWEVTLPLLKPAIINAALLVFLFDFTSFGVILLLGGPQFATLEVEIYLQTMQMLNLPLAGILSMIQLGFTLLIVSFSGWVGRGKTIPLTPRLHGEGTHSAKTNVERVFVISMSVLLLILLFSPLAALALRSVYSPGELGLTTTYFQELFINRRSNLFYVPPIEAGLNSLVVAVTAVLIALTVGIPAAVALAHPHKGERWLGLMLMLPLGASAVTLGLGFIVAFNHPPLDVSHFPLLLPIAHSLVALPFVVRAVQPALASVPASLRQAASVLGAKPLRAWWEVDAQVAMRALLVGALYAFTISMGEFGATSFLARPETPTLPLAIYRFLSQPGDLNYGQAMAMATLLMVVCAAGLFVMEKLENGTVNPVKNA
ncbi:MAG TPA: iron ABC transporter permease [Longilinea sp.]|nr:iron ABC transporter permease [Longilinea sp.]